jgi:chromosome transmission fidelity protein 1
VIEHALKSRLADLRTAQEVQRNRLAEAREKERQRRKKATGVFRGAKRVKVDHDTAGGAGDKGDEEFLPEDSAGGDGAGFIDTEGEGGNLSKEVRALMAK